MMRDQQPALRTSVRRSLGFLNIFLSCFAVGIVAGGPHLQQQAKGMGQPNGTMGTGMSTESFVAPSFGFVISHPKTVAARNSSLGCALKARCDHMEFGFENKPHPVAGESSNGNKTSFSLEFASDARTHSGNNSTPLISDLDQLLDALNQQLPGLTWSKIGDTPYAPGYISQDTRGGWLSIKQAFLFAPGQVVIAQTTYEESSKEGWVFNSMLQSIRSQYLPPKILAIEAEKKRVSPGGKSCWRITADDVRGYLSPASIQSFDLFEEAPKAPHKQAEMLPLERNLTTVELRLCHEVTRAMGNEHLVPSSFEVENLAGLTTTCEHSATKDNRLSFTCNKKHQLTAEMPRTTNRSPDRQSPTIEWARIDSKGNLELKAKDSSPSEVLQVLTTWGKRNFILPQASSSSLFRGFVGDPSRTELQIVTTMAVSDHHGWLTMLRLDKEKGHYFESRNHKNDFERKNEIPRPDIPALSFWLQEKAP